MTLPDVPGTAQILPFGDLRRLTMADRIEALQWEATRAQHGARLAFHYWSSTNAHEGGDYISIYRGDDRWAAWGATRCGRSISVWRCATGADLGQFPTMREALAAVRMAAVRSEAPS